MPTNVLPSQRANNCNCKHLNQMDSSSLPHIYLSHRLGICTVPKTNRLSKIFLKDSEVWERKNYFWTHFRDASEFFFTLDYNFQVNLGTWDGATCYKAQGFGECRELNFGKTITLIPCLCNLLFSNVDIVNSNGGGVLILRDLAVQTNRQQMVPTNRRLSLVAPLVSPTII